MKRFFLFSWLILFILFNHTSAQFVKGYGFKLGLTKASQNWDSKSTSPFELDSRTGMNVGIFAETIGLLGLSFLGEMNYTQKGMTYDILQTSKSSPEPIGLKTVDNRIDYLSFSFLGKYSFGMLLFNPYLIGGPRVDIEVTKNIYTGFDQIYDDSKKSILGWSIGVGVELGKFLPWTFLAEIKYNFDTTKAYESENLTIKNNSYEIRGGIRF